MQQPKAQQGSSSQRKDDESTEVKAQKSPLTCQENFGSAFPDPIIAQAWDVKKEQVVGTFCG